MTCRAGSSAVLAVMVSATAAAHAQTVQRRGASDATAASTAAPPVSALLSKLPVRNIGPGIPGQNSRVSDLAVYEKDPRIFFVGSASGGVFKTEDGGKTFTALFDREGASSIGAVAVSQNDPNVVWVGTGEGWHRNDVGWGDGIYKTIDGGKTWQNMGLPNSNGFGKIVIHPSNHDIVFAAVLGSAWGHGSDRGVYRTTDGGKTWEKVLYVDEKTGAADLAIDPGNPKKLLAAMWDHVFQPWYYRPGGPGSGIFRSTDGGNTWHKVSQGLPTSDLGRIAISYFPKDPRHVAAMVEAKAPATGFYRSADGGETWVEMPAVPLDRNGKPQPERQLQQWGRPFYNNLVRFDPEDVNRIYHGSPFHFTADGGKTFVGGTGDSHGLWIDPRNPKHILHADDAGVSEVWDGGSTDPLLQMRVHYFGLPPLGQFYAIGYDMRKLYWVMGGMQDNACHMLPTQSRRGGVTYTDDELLLIDDGGVNIADPEDWTTVYSLGRGSTIERFNLLTGSKQRLNPFMKVRGGKDVLSDATAYADPSSYKEYLESNPRLRASWTAPFIISPWNSKTLYFGANHLLRSTDRGDTWKLISPDLSHDKLEWQVPRPSYAGGATIYQTIRTISESPLKQGMIWVGTDDGNVQFTMNDGAHWTNVTKNIPDLPKHTWMSRIEASRYSEGRAYATFDGHRSFDLNTYVYVTEDYGKTWTKITGNLPAKESVYVIREGLKNPDLLFLGTEFSLWVSLDRGKSWSRYQDWALSDGQKGYLPTVAVYDLAIHPRELDLIIGTHGRSIWTLPIRPLEELTAENRQQDVYFVSPGNVYLFPRSHNEATRYRLERAPGGFSQNTQPGTLFAYHLKQDAKSDARILVTDASGREVYASLTGPAKAGLNVIPWPGSRFGIPIKRPGNYRAVLSIDGKEFSRTLHVEDVWNDEFVTAPPPTYPPNYRLRPPQPQ